MIAPRVYPVPLLWILTLSLAHAQGPISIRVLEGDNAINSIRIRRGHDPVVQVLDSSGEPLADATVSFLLPASGPGATFPTGISLTLQTDSKGRAVGLGLVPNRIEGQFRIRATASWRGETASAVIAQTNAEPASRSAHSKWIVIALAVGGAAAGGVVAASHGSKTSSAESGGTTGGTSSGSGIIPGTPSFGPPK